MNASTPHKQQLETAVRTKPGRIERKCYSHHLSSKIEHLCRFTALVLAAFDGICIARGRGSQNVQDRLQRWARTSTRSPDNAR